MPELQKTASLDEVRRAELESVRVRRDQVELPVDGLTIEPGRPTDLVGVAFSGGGLRSACFSLGVVQSFFRSGFWRFFDYMSTVSGGGYIGSYLTSYVVRHERKVDNTNCPILPKEGSNHQPPDVQRLIYGGRYLVRPWELANKYLVGLLFINVAIFSGLVMLCSLVSLAWRTLDLDFIRNRVSLLGIDGLSGDAAAPFWPFFLFGVCWLIAWMISYFKRGAEAPGIYARRFLFMLVASLLIGMAILYGNGDVNLDFLTNNPMSEPWKPGRSLWATIAGLTIGGMLPFLSPGRLIQSGLNPRKNWEKVVFRIASTAALVGVPLLIIGYLSREDISGYNRHPHRELLYGDLKTTAAVELFWPETNTMLPTVRSLTPGSLPSDRKEDKKEVSASEKPAEKVASQSRAEDELRVRRVLQDLYFGVPRYMDVFPDDPGQFDIVTETKEFKNNLTMVINNIEQDRGGADLAEFLSSHLGPHPTERSSAPAAQRDELSTATTETVRDDESKPLRRLKLLVATIELERARTAKRNEFLGRDNYDSPWSALTLRIRNLAQAVVHLSGLGTSDNDAEEIKVLTHESRSLQRRFAHAITTDVLNYSLVSRDAAAQIVDGVSDYDVARAERERHRDESIRLLSALLKARSPDAGDASGGGKSARSERRKSQASLADISGLDQWQPQDVYELTVLLLEERFPFAFRSRDEPQRRTALLADQSNRFGFFIGSALLFIVFGLWVDLNATSMHRFYRGCITKAFLVPQHNKQESPALSELRTTQFGAPYHILSASTGLVLDHTGHEDTRAGAGFADGSEPDHRTIDAFVFSQRYCGSQVTGYAPTEDYETWIHGDTNHIDLAEATAISGAAVSPGQVSNWLVAFLMLVMNLRLGQWIPNPRRKRPRWRPTVLTLLRSMGLPARNRQYCFVSDGGNCENLGLMQLLQRRCSLIVQIDASCDPEHNFADLGRAMRLASIHCGVRIASIGDDQLDFTAEEVQLRSLDEGWLPHEEDERHPHRGRNCKHHYALGRILYPDGTRGLLVYIKPSFDGDESLDLTQFRRRSPCFPHEPTSDQVFDKDQVESYRELGEHIGAVVSRALPQMEYDINLWNAGRRFSTDDLMAAFEDEWLRRQPVTQIEPGAEEERAADDAPSSPESEPAPPLDDVAAQPEPTTATGASDQRDSAPPTTTTPTTTLAGVDMRDVLIGMSSAGFAGGTSESLSPDDVSPDIAASASATTDGSAPDAPAFDFPVPTPAGISSSDKSIGSSPQTETVARAETRTEEDAEPQTAGTDAPAEPQDDQFVHAARRMLEAPQSDERLNAARQLAQALATESVARLLADPDAIDELQKAVRCEPDADVRIEMVHLLRESGVQNKSVRDTLGIVARWDPVAKVRQRAKEAIETIRRTRRRPR